MNLEKFTFGATPASLYLTNQLNELNNKKFTRKISTCIIGFRTMIAELVDAHAVGLISTHTLSSVLATFDEKVEQAKETLLHGDSVYNDPKVPNELAVDLMVNVIKGELKSVLRRARKVHHIEKSQQRATVNNKAERTPIKNVDGTVIGYEVRKFEPAITSVYTIAEEITAATLQEKSKAKLKRLNKRCELY